jgi:tRNA (guanine26-N2/guanine27-N2)-dimethyltransferase
MARDRSKALNPVVFLSKSYHAMPIQRAMYLQEMAVRILLYTIATTAGRYGRSIEPVLSVGMDFYVRVFVRVMDTKAPVNDLSLHCGMVYQSMHCPSFHIVPHGQMGGKKGNVYQAARLKHGSCTETGSTFKIGGPIWLGPMHDRETLTKALERLGQHSGSNKSSSSSCSTTEPLSLPDPKYMKTKERLLGLLTTCVEELPNAPLYYKVSDLSRTLHVSAPPAILFKSALVNAGYQVSGYHKEPDALKTNAPPHVVWDVMRAWYQQQQQEASNKKKKAPPENSAAAKILAVAPTTTIDFTVAPSVVTQSKKGTNIKRFPMNPEANWGPKSKATGKKRKAETEQQPESDRVD